MTENDKEQFGEFEGKTNLDRYFKGQQANEEIICFFRKHWLNLLPHFALFIIIIAASWTLVVFLFSTSAIANDTNLLQFFLFSTTVALTIYMHRFFLVLINYFLNIVIITNLRILDISKTVYLHHGLDAINLSQVQDVNKKQNGLIKNILQFGEIVITMAATSTFKVLECVPNADFHFRVINKVTQAAKKGMPVKSHFGIEETQQGVKDRVARGLTKWEKKEDLNVER